MLIILKKLYIFKKQKEFSLKREAWYNANTLKMIFKIGKCLKL